MGRIIEAKAVITAEDRTGKVLDGIARKFRDVGKGAKASVEVGKLAKQIDAAQAGLKNIDRFRSTQANFSQARAAYRGTQVEVARIAKELDAARKAASAFDGVKSFSKSGTLATEMASARKQVGELERQFTSAQRSVKAAAGAYDAQAAAIKGAKREAESSGVSVGRLVSEQKRLKMAIDGSNAAILRQAAAERSGTGLAAGMGAAGRRQSARIAESRHLTEGMSAPAKAAALRGSRDDEERRQTRLEQRQSRRDAAMALGGGAGLYVGHKVKEGTHATLHTYREFDKERRFGKAVMGLTDEEQRPLVDQAIHMGATTKYNDVKVLEAQRELAARGLKKDQVMGLMEPAAALGQSLDLGLPAAVKQMEGALFGFKKDISTLEAAKASARQTADVQVKAAKLSGMTPEDISQTYKYGATPARMAGLSEETLLAFGGISKKANMGGDEAGTAFRALVANALSPTRKAKEAMLANGMDYKNYQRNPERIDTGAFVKTVASQYGVKLDKGVQAGLEKIFTNKKLIASPEQFTPAVRQLLSDSLGGDDAKSKKSIAGLANRFRDASMQGVDANALVADLMTAIPKNPALANAIFGSKQGGRIQNALGDPETFKHLIEELMKHSAGYADKVSTERMSGFDGAMSRFEGAITNIESAFGQAWDNDGKGGFLTTLSDAAARATQSLAELPKPVLQVASGLTWLGGKAATSAGTLALVGAAFSLKGSAAALTAAATRLGLAGAIGGAGSAAGAGAGAAGAAGAAAGAAGKGGSKLGKLAKGAAGAVGVGALATLAQEYNTLEAPSVEDGWGKGVLKFLDPRLAEMVYGSGKATPAPVAPNAPAAKAASEFGGLKRVPLPPARPAEVGSGRKPRFPLPPARPAEFGAQAEVTLPEQSVTAAIDPGEIAQSTAALAALRAELASVASQLKDIESSGNFELQGAIGALESRKLDLQRKIRDSEPSGQATAINNTLDKAATASTTAANGGKPLEATVKPDQITARIENLPPVTGQATISLDPQRVIIDLNSDMLNARIEGAVSRKTATMALSSGGARPGAVTMPGAASPPGAK
ncbi:hypothetical protein ASF28_08920 [Methylobacterium sp. Leaf99]|nr:hypothetical protein ASF28_08920 [Methylobacterium sp. Leaf99]